jgi:glucokinase
MKQVFIGTDSGATTSKTCGVFEDGNPITLNLAQSSTNSQAGREAVVRGWIEGVEKFLQENSLEWGAVAGVGLAMPGPYQSYGVLGRAPNLPASFEGWNFLGDYAAALASKAGRAIPVVTGNDGNYGGVAEAAKVRAGKECGVIMLAPGSGLGGAYISPQGLPLDGDTLNGVEAGHMAIPLQLIDLPRFTCGCGRDWGCVESYTAIAGLPQYLEHLLPSYPDHPLNTSPLSPKEKSLSLRTLAQEGDTLALRIFDYQAKALGVHLANLLIAFDAEYAVIGGGLIDPHATTEEFRKRYLDGIRQAAIPWLFPVQQQTIKIVAASLGELSQAIGAALVALYSSKK